ncbi:hypothetical protein Aglo03_45160 [Actinokineospora globicatena]|uniref:PemK-like, MazF-like toxin of type II toxin-antitoxin system n=1 Tax=Actinokineospora globicatena TaxID=103729 RepID=A0A9W6QRY6_9PSEU|nr:hypothetical protein Aglo03_45160 [Actinokineospora globicatena]
MITRLLRNSTVPVLPATPADRSASRSSSPVRPPGITLRPVQIDDDPRPASGAVWQVPTSDRPENLGYAPDLDGDADPGEIVWAWVPYEDDPERGKDRPLLVVGRTGSSLRALMLSSKPPRPHEEDDSLELGSGAWDRNGRVSYLRLDRLFGLGEHDIRREGSVLDRERFELVADTLRTRYGWH